MTAQLNHTIIQCRDKSVSAPFLAEVLGLPEPISDGPFLQVDLDNSVSLAFMNVDGPIESQHFAFLISESDFDRVLTLIKARNLEHWADPMKSRPGEINNRAGGRGVYFPDPDGHFLEVLTRTHA